MCLLEEKNGLTLLKYNIHVLTPKATNNYKLKQVNKNKGNLKTNKQLGIMNFNCTQDCYKK